MTTRLMFNLGGRWLELHVASLHPAASQSWRVEFEPREQDCYIGCAEV